MLQSPENYVLCEIEKKFQDHLGNILIDTTWEPAEYATLEGIVISALARVKSGQGRDILGTVNNGDKIFFSYSVIFDYKLQPEDENPVYANLIIFEGREYWKVHMGEIFCVVSNDEYRMVTDHLLLLPSSETTGIVKAKPDIKLSCNVRDIVCFEPKFVQKYNIFGEEHYIIPSRRVLAKVA